MLEKLKKHGNKISFFTINVLLTLVIIFLIRESNRNNSAQIVAEENSNFDPALDPAVEVPSRTVTTEETTTQKNTNTGSSNVNNNNVNGNKNSNSSTATASKPKADKQTKTS